MWFIKHERFFDCQIMAPPSYASFTTQLLEFCYRQKQKLGGLDAMVVSLPVLKEYTCQQRMHMMREGFMLPSGFRIE